MKNFITPEYNIFVIDDFVIDKFYSKSTEFTYYCWSNLHKRVVMGMHVVVWYPEIISHMIIINRP
ncbi:hypothetical protein [Methanotorris formicicus]|uniref:hypothetical protein n=1 Tax=Methanotorris formicicus TaxID=213185 RepID=UPI003A4DA2F8